MNFLLIGGQPNTGKSETILRFANKLSNRYMLKDGIIPQKGDCSIILKGINKIGNQTKILIHTATDNEQCIKQLQEQIIENKPEIIICSIRDIGWERDRVLNIVLENFSFEVPLAKITRTTYKNHSLNWYQPNMDRIIDFISSYAPFNL